MSVSLITTGVGMAGEPPGIFVYWKHKEPTITLGKTDEYLSRSLRKVRKS